MTRLLQRWLHVKYDVRHTHLHRQCAQVQDLYHYATFFSFDFFTGFSEGETHTTKFASMAALSYLPWTKHSGEYCFIID